MNMTEAMEMCFQMALRCGELEGVSRQQRQALLKYGVKVRTARQKLDKVRKERRIRTMGGHSASELVAQLKGLPSCDACGWQGGVNILKCCNRGFGCSLDCLRYRSSEVNPQRTA